MSSWHLFNVTDMAHCHCRSDEKSISVIQGITLPACSRVVLRGLQAVCADLKIADLQPAGWMCGLQISDPQTEHVMIGVLCSLWTAFH